MHNHILLDSSIWVCYFRSRGNRQVKKVVQAALEELRVHTCWVVIAEILVGARDRQAYQKLLTHLNVLPNVKLTDALWEQSAQLGQTLRRKGISAPLPDLLIAQAAIDNELTLWHLDKHFEAMRPFCPLQTRSFL